MHGSAFSVLCIKRAIVYCTYAITTHDIMLYVEKKKPAHLEKPVLTKKMLLISSL